MQTIDVLIVEDDPIQQDLLTVLLKPFDYLRIVDCVASGEAFIQAAALNPHLSAVFLDIDLGGGRSGLESYSILKFRGIHVPTVLVTGSKPDPSHLYDLDIVDILEKPFTKFRLNQAIKKLLNHTRYQQFVRAGGLFVPIVNENIQQVSPSDILFFESVNRTILVHTKSGTVETKIPLKTYENYLKDCHFTSTHRSYLVNLEQVTEIRDCKVTFTNDNRFALTTEENEAEMIKIWLTSKKVSPINQPL